MKRVKTLFALWLAMALSTLFPVLTAQADPLPDGGPYTNTVDGIDWSFYVQDGEAIIGVQDEYGNWIWQKAVSPEPTGALVVPDKLGGCDVTGIQCGAFENCGSITNIVFPAALRELGPFACYNCYSVEGIQIAENLQSIGYCALAFNNSLRSIQVAGENKCFTADDGVLYDKDKTDVIFWPCHKPICFPSTLRNIRPYSCIYNSNTLTIDFPSSVTNIGGGAFCWVDRLREVSLNEGLQVIGECAFQNTRIRSVVVPSTVTAIAYDVFSGCEYLTSVFFAGNAPTEVAPDFYSGTGEDLITYVRSNSVGWVSADSSALPETWPAIDELSGQGSPRTIRTWTTYPELSWRVRFDLGEHGSTEDATEQYVIDGHSAVAPKVVADDGYQFLGWDRGLDCIDRDVNVSAVYIWKGNIAVENFMVTPGPAWSHNITIAYEVPYAAASSNQTAVAYCLLDGEWIELCGDLPLTAGTHSQLVNCDDADVCLPEGDVVFKLAVFNVIDGGIEVDNDDGWTLDGDKPYNGKASWRSRAISDDEETSLTAYFSGSGTLSFVWRTSSEKGCDELGCSIDGEEDQRCKPISGETSKWLVRYFKFNKFKEAGDHSVTWTYRKDVSVSEGEDCGWVADIAFRSKEATGECATTAAIPSNVSTYELEATWCSDDDTMALSVYDVEEGIVPIYYTLDGSVPTTNSAVYTRPVAWDAFKDLRAVAVDGDGGWSEMLKGSDFVRITFDPALGTITEGPQAIVRRIDDCIGELPTVERGDYAFLGWTYNPEETEGGIDEDCVVEEEMTTLYATWEVPAADIIDPAGELSVSFNEDCVEFFSQRELTSQWREYVQLLTFVAANTNVTAMTMEFDGVGTLDFGPYWSGGGHYLDGNWCCADDDNRLDVPTDGHHLFEVRYYNSSDEDANYCHTAGGITWIPGIEAGGDVNVPSGYGSATDFAGALNSGMADKADYLRAPGGVTTTDTYLSYFSAVPSGETAVAFVLNAEGTNAVAAAGAAAGAEALSVALAPAETSLSIDSPLVGFYYSLKQGGEVGNLLFNDEGDCNKLGGRDVIRFDLTKPDGAGFYQTIITPTEYSAP